MMKSDVVEVLNSYAKSKGVVAIIAMSLDGLTLGLFVPPGELEFESSRSEDISCHIDMMALSIREEK